MIAALNKHRCQKREAEREAERQQMAAPRRGPSKKLRERYEADDRREEERRRNEDGRIGTIVLSIIERLGEENVSFLIDQSGRDRWTVIDRLGEEVTKRRQVAA